MRAVINQASHSSSSHEGFHDSVLTEQPGDFLGIFSISCDWVVLRYAFKKDTGPTVLLSSLSSPPSGFMTAESGVHHQVS